MKRKRVLITSAVVAILVLILALVPMPISRIRGLAVVQPHPDASSQIVLRNSAILSRLKVQPGERVTRGQILAEFRDMDLEAKLASSRADRERAQEYLKRLEQQRSSALGASERNKLQEEIAQTTGERDIAQSAINSALRIQQDELFVKAPHDGVIGQGPKIEDVGKTFEGSREQAQAPPLFTIHSTDQMRVCLPLVTSDYNQLNENLQALAREDAKSHEGRELPVTLRVHGLDSATWTGRIARLDQSEAKFVPLQLSSRAGGPVPVHPPTGKTPGLVPQTQHYLVYIDITDPSQAITVGSMAQVKISCRPETCLSWAWRTVNNVFNLRLL